MKAYLVVSGYDYDFEIDSVFINKEDAQDYIKKNNEIPFDDYYKFRIQEVELNPSDNEKKIVEIHGYANNDNEIRDLEIERIDREGLEQLKDFTGDDIALHLGMLYSVEKVIFFDGRIDVTSCKDLGTCNKYIEDTIIEKLKNYNQNERDDKI